MKNDQKLVMSNSFFRSILQAAAKKESALSTYEKVFVKNGHEFIEYPQFELWYHRFVQKKEVALKMEKKENQQPSRLEFSNLTTDVISKILDNLDVPSRLHARNTSKSLRDLIDSQNPNITSIEFRSLLKSMTVVFRDSNRKTSRFSYQEANTPRGVYLYRAQSFLAPILRNPKLKLTNLKLKNQLAVERFTKILRAQKSKIHVESLKISSDVLETLLPILQCLEPRTLKAVKWNMTKIGNIQNFGKLFETNHWKNLECFKCIGGAEFPMAERFQNLAHLKSFEVVVSKITGEFLDVIKDQLLSSAHIQAATFRVTDLDFDFEEIPGIFGDFLKIFNITYKIEREERYFGCLRIRRI